VKSDGRTDAPLALPCVATAMRDGHDPELLAEEAAEALDRAAGVGVAA